MVSYSDFLESLVISDILESLELVVHTGEDAEIKQ